MLLTRRVCACVAGCFRYGVVPVVMGAYGRSARRLPYDGI